MNRLPHATLVALAVLLMGASARAGELPAARCAGSTMTGSARESVNGTRDPALGDPAFRRDRAGAGDVLGASHYRLSNGLDVTLYSAPTLAERVELRGGDAVLPLDGGRYLRVITDVGDPAIYNKGDGAFHAFSTQLILDVLESMTHPLFRSNVTIYALPYPRRNVLVSSASGNEVFLSPHVLDVNPAVGAYVISHELGHVFQYYYLPDGSPSWREYRRLRGIEDESRFSASAAHAYRPGEIFAEDFRVLFGGPDAAFGGRIENPELVTPTAVGRLERFLTAVAGRGAVEEPVVEATSYPNPFNPSTEIRISVPASILRARRHVTVRIFDVRGALVKELYSDVPAAASLQMVWNGLDRSGNRVASAPYFARIQAGDVATTLKLLLVK